MVDGAAEELKLAIELCVMEGLWMLMNTFLCQNAPRHLFISVNTFLHLRDTNGRYFTRENLWAHVPGTVG